MVGVRPSSDGLELDVVFLVPFRVLLRCHQGVGPVSGVFSRHHGVPFLGVASSSSGDLVVISAGGTFLGVVSSSPDDLVVISVGGTLVSVVPSPSDDLELGVFSSVPFPVLVSSHQGVGPVRGVV